MRFRPVSPWVDGCFPARTRLGEDNHARPLITDSIYIAACGSAGVNPLDVRWYVGMREDGLASYLFHNRDETRLNRVGDSV